MKHFRATGRYTPELLWKCGLIPDNEICERGQLMWSSMGNWGLTAIYTVPITISDSGGRVQNLPRPGRLPGWLVITDVDDIDHGCR